MGDDPFEPLLLFRPRIKGRRSARDRHEVPTLRSLVMRGLHGRRSRSGEERQRSRKASLDVGEVGPNARRCLIKSHYVPVTPGGRDAARLHLAYLERDGVERDGSQGHLYGPRESFDHEAFGREDPAERRQFRFIVSPEDRGVDLTSFARALMAQMEKDLGRPLVWTAVNHHNTEHPHVHIVVRGIDGRGEDLRIPPRYIQQDMRARAQQILTRELGIRTEVEFARQRAAEVDQERLTSLDRKLGALLDPDGRVTARQLAGLPRAARASLLARLGTLSRLGLAERGRLGAWDLAEGWQQHLASLGQRNDVIKRLHRAAPGDPSRYRVTDPAQLTSPIEGVVRGKGLHDELRGELFAIVETASGESHYVRLEQRAAEWLQAGDVVRVARATEPWVKPTDRVLVRIAELNDGVYDPQKHSRQLATAPEQRATPEELVAGNLRRLERLERYGLVRRLTKGRWQVPSDLLQQLQSREKTHPRHRLRVEYVGGPLDVQTTYAGPTWLDGLPTEAPDRALWGFGSDLAKAIGARGDYLRQRGLEPGSSTAARHLDAAERALLGRRLASELGGAYVEPSAGFQGTLSACPPLPSGRAFVRIVDERTRRIVLVPANTETARLEGRAVEVLVDRNQRLVVRSARDRTRGEE